MPSIFPDEEAAQLDKTERGIPWDGPSSPHWYAGLGDADPEDIIASQGSGLPAGLHHLVRQSIYSGVAGINLALKKASQGSRENDMQFNTSRLHPNAPPEVTTHNPADELQGAREFVQRNTPDPATTGAAVQILHGLGKGLTEITAGSLVGGPIAGAATVGATEGLGKYDELQQQGVDNATAKKMASLTALTSAAGAVVPFGWGSGLVSRVATGAVANTGFGMATRYADHVILENAGYHDMAEQQKMMDSTQMLTDAVMGAGFGWMTHMSKAEAARVKALRETPGVEDAAHTMNLAAADRRAAPGVPVDNASANAHAAALEKAVQDVTAGRPVDVSETGIDQATMVPREAVDTAPIRRVMAEHFKEVGLLDEDANLHDFNRMMKPAEQEAPPKPITVTHTADETGLHTVTSPNGEVTAQENGKYLQIKRADVAEAARGKGEASAMYQELAKQAQDRGLSLASDISVSPDAQKLYKGLEKRGYEVKQNQDAEVNPKTGNLVSNDPRIPVFEVGKKEEAPTSPVAQILKDKPDLEITNDKGEKVRAFDALQAADMQAKQEVSDMSKAISAAIACFGRF